MHKFLLRMLRNALVAFAVVGGGLALGASGYHYIEGLAWIDALLNASMILFGMGPVDPVRTFAGKLFATFYAMFSGMVFLSVTAVLFAPLFHRMIHRFHLQIAEDDDPPHAAAKSRPPAQPH